MDYARRAVIPAQAGIRRRASASRESLSPRRRAAGWIPAFAGMTIGFAFLIALYSPTVLAAVPTEDRPIAVLRALDKITARVDELSVPIEQPYKFGTLTIVAHACKVTSPEEKPEAAAFLEVSETKPNAPETNVFRGWMFASSPALSAMEHPVYDLWVTDCKSASVKPSQP